MGVCFTSVILPLVHSDLISITIDERKKECEKKRREKKEKKSRRQTWCGKRRVPISSDGQMGVQERSVIARPTLLGMCIAKVGSHFMIPRTRSSGRRSMQSEPPQLGGREGIDITVTSSAQELICRRRWNSSERSGKWTLSRRRRSEPSPDPVPGPLGWRAQGDRGQSGEALGGRLARRRPHFCLVARPMLPDSQGTCRGTGLRKCIIAAHASYSCTACLLALPSSVQEVHSIAIFRFCSSSPPQ
ncbi:hypothetical protein F4780DRAFT_173453 [Xylariomycetidae sp. FL0641]|nr:hypothetical protein F4780DRAFT_173453 [Xylariomycetidae sp. FL0641]